MKYKSITLKVDVRYDTEPSAIEVYLGHSMYVLGVTTEKVEERTK